MEKLDTIDVLTQRARRANEALGRAQEAARTTAHRALIGKTYRYRNNYSCPEKPSDYFWLYMRVTGVKAGLLVVRQFYTDKYGHITITPSYELHCLTDGYREIAPSKFKAAWRALQQRIARMS